MTKIPEGLSSPVTPEQVYHIVPEVPEGWEFVRFGVAREGEFHLDRCGAPKTERHAAGYPRIVVREMPKTPTEQERVIAQQAAALAGIIDPGMLLGPSTMEVFVERLRRLDLPKILAEDILALPMTKKIPPTEKANNRIMTIKFSAVISAWSDYCGRPMSAESLPSFFIELLRNLGIEVEDQQ